MKLTVDRMDLLPEHENINYRQTKLGYFKPNVQAAIIAAGGATFREYDGSNYNRIRVDEARADYVVARCPRCGSVVYASHFTYLSHSDVRWEVINLLHEGFEIVRSTTNERGGDGCDLCKRRLATAVGEAS